MNIKLYFALFFMIFGLSVEGMLLNTSRIISKKNIKSLKSYRKNCGYNNKKIVLNNSNRHYYHINLTKFNPEKK